MNDECLLRIYDGKQRVHVEIPPPSACQFINHEQPQINAIMKIKKMFVSILVCYFFIVAFTHCSSSPEQPNPLSASYDSLHTVYQQLLDENSYLEDELNEASYKADSLGSLYYALQKSIQKKPVFSQEEREFATLVPKVNDALATMIKTKDTQKVLNFFHDRFTSNVIQISMANQVSVNRKNSSTLPQHLEYLANEAGITYLNFSVKDILALRVRNDQLGIMVFTNDFEVRKENGEVIRGEDLIQVVAKKYNGAWKIGNYSSIFLSDYEKMITQ
jgi:hypothetical protein